MDYDIIIIGSGPGGYVAAIRSSQLGMKTAIVEKSELGGVCLNWGCIPTKSLLKSAEVLEKLRHSEDFGISVKGEIQADFKKIIERSRNVADGMSKGVRFLMKKNKIDVLNGVGKIPEQGKVEVIDEKGEAKTYTTGHIIIATGARSKELPNLKQDGKKIIGYRQAMTLEERPEKMLVVGSGAIGTEFAYFYNSMGTEVTLVEFMPEIVPNEDEDISRALAKSLKKSGIKIFTGSEVTKVDTSGDKCKVTLKTPKKEEEKEADIILSAVGISPNTENLGLEDLGIEMEKGFIKVDEFMRTSIEGIYAIGDVVPTAALAHLASAEGILCVEKISGMNPEPLDYNNVPGCTYTNPEVASVGLSEKKAREAGFEVKIGKFPFTASGKASAAGARDGFVKMIFDKKHGELLGAHMIGANVTEMISEIVLGKKLEVTGHEIIKSIHPHPTMSEAIMESAAAAFDEVIHI